MRRLAVISFHTSPLAQPGTGDGGGMNVYVRELTSALARAGVECDVYTRASSPLQPATVVVEPGFRVHHVPAGPLEPMAKEQLPAVVDEFSEIVAGLMAAPGSGGVGLGGGSGGGSGSGGIELGGGVGLGGGSGGGSGSGGIELGGGSALGAASEPLGGAAEVGFDAIHANYWLSGLVGHRLKHELDLPLVSTFHTLARVKAEASPEEVFCDEPHRRAEAEAAIMACSEVVLASCSVEADQLVELYGADPERVRVVAPGVDHAFFAPGDRAQARRAVGLGPDGPILLFVGRIQPLKGAAVAVDTLAALEDFPAARLVLVGGPSGPRGEAHLAEVRDRARRAQVADRVQFVDPQPHELLSSFYRAADVCLVPSRSESFGLVALEAGACGTPVVASAVGGLTTLVDDQVTGVLVDSSSPADFARAVRSVLRRAGTDQPMARAAAARARHYTWEQAARQLRDTYQALADRRLAACR